MTARHHSRRVGWRAAAAFGAAMALASDVGPVAADEFPAAVVVPTSGGAAVEGGDALAGFRVAVDASPDVSHPPGAEGGDHLGGSDVDVAVIDAGGTPAVTAAAARAQGDAGTGIVVVLAPPPGVLAAVQEALRDVDVLIIVAGDSATSPEGGGRTVVLRDRGGDAGSGVAFEAAFRAAQGRPPTPAAASGYDAGVAIDLAVDAFGMGARDPARVSGLLADTDRFARSAVAAPAPGAAPAERAGSPVEVREAKDPSPRGIILAVGVIIVVAGLAGTWWLRRSASTRRRRSPS